MAEFVAAQTLREDGEVLLARLGACGGHVAQTGAEWRLYNAAGAARPQGTVSPDLVRLLEARGHLVARAGGGLEPRVLAQARTAAARFTGRCEVQARGRARLPAINAAESPLGWLRAHKGAGGRALISVEQFMAGEQLRADHERACLAPRVTANWDELAAAGRGRRGAQAMAEVSDGAIAARRKVQVTCRGGAGAGQPAGPDLLPVGGHGTGRAAARPAGAQRPGDSRPCPHQPCPPLRLYRQFTVRRHRRLGPG